MHQPYGDRPQTSGMLTIDTDTACARMQAAHLAGLSVCVHAIGDRANHTAAELFDRILRRHPGHHRHRIEHASVLDDATLARLAEHDITAVVQPISIHSERRWLRDRLGDERLARTYPYRSMLDAGVTVAYSSDAPIEDTDVLAALHAAVDRHGVSPEQAVTPIDALGMATTAAATVRGTDDQGSIAPGQGPYRTRSERQP
jgi:predicted amidohydrolase YtcJ